MGGQVRLSLFTALVSDIDSRWLHIVLVSSTMDQVQYEVMRLLLFGPDQVLSH